jgi:hypothetical protein
MAARTRVLRVHAVDIDVDETATHWVVYARPHLELEARGIRPMRAKKLKCRCREQVRGEWVTAYGVCRWADCRGWTALGAANYMRKLLRSYPKVPVKVGP